jgi:hypothetical protein
MRQYVRLKRRRTSTGIHSDIYQNIVPFVRNAYRVLVGKHEGNKQLGRPRRRWEDTIKMDLREMGWGGMDWIHLADDGDQWRALVNL